MLHEQEYLYSLQPADIGWPTGNGKKLSCARLSWARQHVWVQLSFFPFPVAILCPKAVYCTSFPQESVATATYVSKTITDAKVDYVVLRN